MSNIKQSIKRIFLCGLLLGTFSMMAIAQISLSVKNKTVKEVVKEIEKTSDYRFFYNEDLKGLSTKVSLKVTNQDIKNVMDLICRQAAISYVLRPNNQVVLSVKVEKKNKTVKGIVTDKNGEPIIGANVIEKGTTNGTITDMDGKYSLEIPAKAILMVSYIGYTPVEVFTENKTIIDISIQEDTQALDEVVVVGYGTQKKVNLSGAVETVSSKALQNRSTSNIGVALQGLVPNLNINPGSGAADATPSFNIRGETSINGGSPLILVDGIPTSAADFSRMNSMDIENISVLKDASSAAIYGARAAFGVILVTTKRGTGEKLTIQFNNNFNIKTLTRMPEVVDDPYIQASYKKLMGKPWYDLYTDEEVEYAKKRNEDPSLPSTIISSLDPSKWVYLDSHDWFDEIFDKTGFSHSHNLSISGASNKVSYYLGAEYYGESGLLHYNKDTYNRFNVRSRVEYKPTEWLTVGNNMALTYFNYNKPTNFSSWMFNQALETNSLVPTRNPDGSYTREGSALIGTLVDGGQYDNNQSTIYTQFNVDVALIKNIWKIKGDFTAKLINSRTAQWDSDRNFPYKTGPDTPENYQQWENFAERRSDKTVYTMVNLYTDFHKDFGIHSLSVLGGYSQEYESYNYFMGSRKDLITDTYPTPQLATGEMNMQESAYAWAIRSAFYRVNYIIDGRYILETNGRYDGTSRFPSKNRFGFFPSVSAAWIISNEKFFKPIQSWFSHAKLRVSYGSLGNQGINPDNPDYYPYISNMTAYKMDYLLNDKKPMGVYPPSVLVSNALSWEKVYTFNMGLDINFFNNRLSLSGDVYRRDTKGMLTKGKTLPNVLGISEPQINAADMKTKGWELSVLWKDQFKLANKNMNYSARFILSDSRSFITRFDNPTRSLYDHYIGQEIGEIWGLVNDGFFKDQADIDNHVSQWEVTAYPGDRPIEPGDLKYKNLNGDDKISKGAETVDDPGDFKIIGNTSNRYNFGLDINAEWNGFDVRFLFQGVGKKDWYPSGYKFFGIYYAPWGNVLENNMDHWTPENPNAYFPRLKSYLANGVGDMGRYPMTRYLQNAAYMRMKNITFGYSLPKSLLHSVKLENVRIFFSGENLFEITSLCRNFDPEALNQSTHPFQRTFSIGLNITL